MAWQANIVEVKKEEKDVVVLVLFNNGTKKLTQDFHFVSGTKESVNAAILSRADSLDSFDQFPVQIQTGPVIRPDPPPLTPKQKFGNDLVLLRRLTNAVNLKVIQATDPLYQNQLQTVVSAFLPEYLDLFNL